MAEGAQKLVDGISDPKSIANLRASLASTQKLLHATAEGDGLMHSLFYDRATAHTLGDLIGHTDRIASELASAIHHVDGVLGATDKDGQQLINNLSRASRNLGEVAGTLHTAQLVPNLDRAAQQIGELVSYMRSGQGTLGALLIDPTAYEQLVTILGGVERSRLLRAAVRYAIAKSEVKQAIPDPPPIAVKAAR